MNILRSAYQAAEKIVGFVGRAFRHDKIRMFSSGVLTPCFLKTHVHAVCLGAVPQGGIGIRWNYAAESILKRNLEPCPTALSTQMRPPCASTICRAIDNPSPVPPASRDLAASTR